MDDDEIERLLRAAPAERWAELAEATTALDQLSDYGRWVAEPGQMPYVVYDEAVWRAVNAVYALGASRPFDWPAWVRVNRYPGGVGLDTAPVAESVRMITAIVRADRFMEGSILSCLQDGTVAAAHRRIQAWSPAPDPD